MSGESASGTDRIEETCPTCGTVHSAGSLRYDRNGDLRCLECIDSRAPYCSRCDHQWTEEPNEAIPNCPVCGSKTSVLPVERPRSVDTETDREEVADGGD